MNQMKLSLKFVVLNDDKVTNFVHRLKSDFTYIYNVFLFCIQKIYKEVSLLLC